MGAPVLYLHTNMSGNCYDVADKALPYCSGEFLCFPSDDSYYVPNFAETMERYAETSSLDLVYCDIFYDKRLNGIGYSVLNVAPHIGQIDKTGFIVRRSAFHGFPPHPSDFRDGALIEDLVARGVRHGKVNDIMAVHS